MNDKIGLSLDEIGELFAELELVRSCIDSWHGFGCLLLPV